MVHQQKKGGIVASQVHPGWGVPNLSVCGNISFTQVNSLPHPTPGGHLSEMPELLFGQGELCLGESQWQHRHPLQTDGDRHVPSPCASPSCNIKDHFWWMDQKETTWPTACKRETNLISQIICVNIFTAMFKSPNVLSPLLYCRLSRSSN